MKRLRFALFAAASVALGAGSTAVQAQGSHEPAWCAYSSGAAGIVQCSYATIEQCRAYVGQTGFCQANPRLTTFASMKHNVKR